MKTKQWQEVKDLTEQELTTQMEQKRKDLFNLSVQHKFAPVKNPLRIRSIRRDIARMKTLFKTKFNKEI